MASVVLVCARLPAWPKSCASVKTLANYAATFVGAVATETNSATSALNYQQELTNSISLKEATLSGVDRDEELAQLIIFQQSYAACAQTFTASKEMLDMLLNMVN